MRSAVLIVGGTVPFEADGDGNGEASSPFALGRSFFMRLSEPLCSVVRFVLDCGGKV